MSHWEPANYIWTSNWEDHHSLIVCVVVVTKSFARKGARRKLTVAFVVSDNCDLYDLRTGTWRNFFRYFSLTCEIFSFLSLLTVNCCVCAEVWSCYYVTLGTGLNLAEQKIMNKERKQDSYSDNGRPAWRPSHLIRERKHSWLHFSLTEDETCSVEKQLQKKTVQLRENNVWNRYKQQEWIHELLSNINNEGKACQLCVGGVTSTRFHA